MSQKLELYNQKLRAIVLTLILLTILIFAVVSAVDFIGNLISDWGGSDSTPRGITLNKESQTEGVTDADAPTQNLTHKVLRDQLISYQDPAQLDSSAGLYLVPVTHIQLDVSEGVEVDEYPALRGSGSSKFGSRRRHLVSGRDVNNLIVFDPLTDSKTAVFNKRTYVHRYEYMRILGRKLLLLEVSQDDSNADGALNQHDLRALQVYDIEHKSMREFAFEGLAYVEHFHVEDSQTFLLKYKADRNGNGMVDEGREPTVIKQLNLKTYAIQDFVDAKMAEKLQTLID